MGIASYIINKVLPVQITKIQRTLAFSTTTPLGASAVYTSPTIDAINYKVFVGKLFSDVAGSYIVQYSDDGIVWDSGSSTSYTAAALGSPSSGGIIARYFRVVFTNGAAAQTTFRLSVYLAPL